MWRPRAWSFFSTRLPIVDLPEPESPVNQSHAGLLPLLGRTGLLVDVGRLPVNVVGPPQGEVQQAGADRIVRQAVDQDETAGISVLPIGVEGDRAIHREVAHADLVQLEPLRGEVLQGIDVHAIFRVGDRRGHGLRPDLQPVGAAREHRLVAHPDDCRLELVGHPGGRIRGGDDVAAADVDLVGQRQRDRLPRDRVGEIAPIRDEARHAAFPPRRLHPNAVIRPNGPARHDAGEAPEVGVRPVDPLDGHPERGLLQPRSRPTYPGNRRAAPSAGPLRSATS